MGCEGGFGFSTSDIQADETFQETLTEGSTGAPIPCGQSAMSHGHLHTSFYGQVASILLHS